MSAGPPLGFATHGNSRAERCGLAAPQRAGLRAVWNRAGLPRPSGLRPDAEVASLQELPEVLARLL